MADTPTTTRSDTGRDWRQHLALAVGAVYTLVGIAGFFVTGFDDFAGNEGETLLGFELNPLHNIVHLVIGLMGLASWARRDLTRAFGLALLVGYGAAFVYGLFAANEDWDFLAINGADNGLHIVSALAGAVIATVPQLVGRRVRGEASASTTRSRTRTTQSR
jgi:hypothetical protein